MRRPNAPIQQTAAEGRAQHRAAAVRDATACDPPLASVAVSGGFAGPFRAHRPGAKPLGLTPSFPRAGRLSDLPTARQGG